MIVKDIFLRLGLFSFNFPNFFIFFKNEPQTNNRNSQSLRVNFGSSCFLLPAETVSAANVVIQFHLSVHQQLDSISSRCFLLIAAYRLVEVIALSPQSVPLIHLHHTVGAERHCL